MNRPPHYEKIHGLVMDIVNSHNKAGEWAAYNKIKEICETHKGTILDHPFQWETLGDYTDSNSLACLEYYFTGLDLAEKLELDEYRASIQIAVAEYHLENSEYEKAWEFAQKANESASNVNDLVLKQEISSILLEITKYT